MDDALLEAVRMQDEALARRGLAIWLGAEPTFTDRSSQDPWWLTDAEGGDKEQRARQLLTLLAPRLGHPLALQRVRGRHYQGEPRPRFAYGVLYRRAAALRLRLASGEAPLRAGGDGLPLDLSGLDGAAAAPPPCEDGDAWLTVTPDPAVVEVNTAPAPDLCTFAAEIDAMYRAAADVRLSPVRYRYNGDVSESGGGGQLTLGGPTPERSPFFAEPQLLPRLVRYMNRHPSLSYLFGPDCLGSAGQGPRPDEGVRERFEELAIAVERLSARGDRLAPDELWSTLAPLLVDASGNSHRAELNVEKLWNPYDGHRGKLGLVELRALRMQPSPLRATAVAALYRGVAARLSVVPFNDPLADWGADLHDRYGLPSWAREDLATVLDDLAACGFAPGPALSEVLVTPEPPLAEVRLGDARLTLTAAQEFWPLFGDVASQERAGARLVDSSTSRVEVAVAHPKGDDPGRVSAHGWLVPLQPLGGSGRCHVGAVRWRAFQPRPGLHPGLPPTDPVVVTWERGGERVAVELHGWRPGGGAYDGLPRDAAEAERRRCERVVFRSHVPPTQVSRAPTRGITLDLRRVGTPPPGADPP